MTASMDPHAWAWGSIALFLFVAGFVLLVLRNPVEIEPIWTTTNRAAVEYQCVYCKATSVLKLPAPREYAQKFDEAFRLLHLRCIK